MTWTCAATPGGRCTGAGAGAVADRVRLPPGGAATYTVTGAVPPIATGSLTQTASATPPPATIDPDATNNSDRVVTPLLPRSDVAVDLSVAPPAAATGAAAILTVTVTNAGPSDAAGFRVSNQLPPSLTPVSWICAPGPPVCAGGTGALTDFPALAAGAVATYTVTTTALPDYLGPFEIVAAAVPAQRPDDPDLSNNRATTAVSLLPPPGTVQATLDVSGKFLEGSTVTYTLVLVNNGPVQFPDSPGAEIVLSLPSAVAVTDISTSSGTASGGGSPGATVFWNGPLALGETVVIVVEGMILPGSLGSTAVAQGELDFIDELLDAGASGKTSPPGEPSGPTVFVVRTVLEIPSLTFWGMALLVLLLAVAGAATLGSWRAS